MRNADDVQEVDVLLAECHLVAGDPAQALEIVEAISAASPTRLAALERTRGRALLALGDDAAAREALEASLADAREQDALYEIAPHARRARRPRRPRRRPHRRPSSARRSAPSCSGRLGVRVDPERRISLIDRDPSARAARRHAGTRASRPGEVETASRRARDPSKKRVMSTRQKSINGYRIEPFANLQGAQLQRARLGGMNLYCVNLRNADLTEADLRGAYLAEAQLSGALLTACDMVGVNLSGATLQRAILNGVDLTEANLRNADLSWRPHVRRRHQGREVLPDDHA